jgi:hypothetical protein
MPVVLRFFAVLRAVIYGVGAKKIAPMPYANFAILTLLVPMAMAVENLSLLQT